jgi:hypothetical protein
MSTTAVETPPHDAYLISEAGESLGESALNPDGTVDLIIIRPGEGRGRGNHYYSADMLRENADIFQGWPMYVDHLAPEARKAMGGLPRSLRDIGGVIQESWWDETVPAEGRFEQGAVVGRAKPLGLAKTLIEEAPALVRASISTSATAVHPKQVSGKRLWAVEGFQPRGSVDWVTEAGAGGQLRRLMESLDVAAATLDLLSDEEFYEHLRTHRPQLLEALASEEEDMDVTPETLREALQSEEGKAVLAEAIQAEAKEIVEGMLDTERDLIRAEARAEAQRPMQLRDLRDRAHARIDGAKLPEKFASEAKTHFALDEAGAPTPALDVIDDLDDEFKVTKPAAEKLDEAVDSEIERLRDLAASVSPTRVKGQGAKAAPTGDGKEKVEEGEHTPGMTSGVRDLLQHSGFTDPDEVYAGRS